MIYHLEFKNHKYVDINSDGIDSDRYIIPFILTKREQPPISDSRSEHIITIEISGSDLAIPGLWNCKKSEIPKIVFAHAFEYIKSLMVENRLSPKIKLNLDKLRLSKYPVDPNKVPSINEYNFEFEID